MNKNPILTEDYTNVVLDVILRKVTEDPELAEEDDEPGRWYYKAFCLGTDGKYVDDAVWRTLRNTIYSIGDHDPDATMRELCKDKFHVTMVHEHDDDGDETNRMYVMLDVIYAVEQSKANRDQFVKNLTALINKMLEAAPGVYLDTNPHVDDEQ